MDSRADDAEDPRRATPEELLAHAGWARRLARSLVLDAHAADDVVQDAWIAALAHPPLSDRPLRPWLARVISNFARNAHRGESRRRAREDASVDDRQAPPTADVASSLEMQRVLLDAVERLDEPLRSTVVRAYFHARTSVEIAQEDGVADGTVRWRLKQALDRLRERLDARYRGERRAWIAFLVPLAQPAESLSKAGAASGSSRSTMTKTATVTGTVIGMSLVVKLGAAAVLVAGVVLVLRGANRSEPVSPSETTSSSVASELTRPEAAASKRGSAVESTTAVAAATASDISAATASAAKESFVEARVLDARGQPIANALLICVDRVELEEITRDEAPQATSDHDGRARLALVPADASKHRGRNAGRSADSWVAIVEIEAKGHSRLHTEVAVQSGHTASLGDIMLSDAGDVRGRVVDSDGRVVASADVKLMLPELTLDERDARDRHVDHSRSKKEFTTSRSDGTFAFRSIQAGVYRVWAEKSGFLAGFTETIDVQAGLETKAADLVLATNTRAIHGRVVRADGTPCKNPEIEVSSAGADDWVGNECDKDGHFVVESVPTGGIDIYAVNLGSETGDAVARAVAAGTGDLVIRVAPARFTELLVRDDHDTPLEHYRVGVHDLRGNGGGDNMDRPGGRARVKTVAKAFRLTVSASGFESRVFGPFTSSDAPATLNVTLKPVARISGHVTAEGQPLGRANVRLFRVLDSHDQHRCNGFPTRFESEHELSTNTGADGAFSFDCCEPGRFVLAVQAKGFAFHESRELELSPEHGAEDLVIAMTSGGALAGRLLTGAGDTPIGSWVTASRGFGMDTSAPVELGGTFQIEHLAAGTWWIRRTDRDYGSSSAHQARAANDPTLRTVDVIEGQMTTFDLDVRATPPGQIVGTFTIPGEDMRVWTASLVPPGGDDSDRVARPIGTDGSFRIAVPEIGRSALTVIGSAGTDRDARVEIEIELASGENRWTLSVPTGTLDLDGPGLARGLLAHVRKFDDGSTFTTRFRSKSGASLHLAGLPAGKATIVDAKSHAVLIDVDVPARGHARATLP